MNTIVIVVVGLAAIFIIFKIVHHVRDFHDNSYEILDVVSTNEEIDDDSKKEP